jgi:hypothetical protein
VWKSVVDDRNKLAGHLDDMAGKSFDKYSPQVGARHFRSGTVHRNSLRLK